MLASEKIERETTLPSEGNLVTTGAPENKYDLSITIILQNTIKIKLNSKKVSDERKSVKRSYDVDSTGEESELEKDTTLFLWLAVKNKRSQYCKHKCCGYTA